jgi:hypothetical protein
MLRDDLNPLEPVALDAPERRTSALLAIDQLGKTFGSGVGQVQALSPTDLYVQEGDFLCVVGPSGCGKTTLLNLVAGFERPSSGQVRLRGQPITGPGAERGVVFQQGALFNWMTVLENVAFGPRACGVSPQTARQRARRRCEPQASGRCGSISMRRGRARCAPSRRGWCIWRRRRPRARAIRAPRGWWRRCCGGNAPARPRPASGPGADRRRGRRSAGCT